MYDVVDLQQCLVDVFFVGLFCCCVGCGLQFDVLVVDFVDEWCVDVGYVNGIVIFVVWKYVEQLCDVVVFVVCVIVIGVVVCVVEEDVDMQCFVVIYFVVVVQLMYDCVLFFLGDDVDVRLVGVCEVEIYCMIFLLGFGYCGLLLCNVKFFGYVLLGVWRFLGKFWQLGIY